MCHELSGTSYSGGDTEGEEPEKVSRSRCPGPDEASSARRRRLGGLTAFEFEVMRDLVPCRHLLQVVFVLLIGHVIQQRVVFDEGDKPLHGGEPFWTLESV